MHNSFARSTPFADETQRAPDDPSEDAFHFIAYTPVNGTLYELDGLRPHPLNHGSYDETAPEGWLAKAREVVERRIATYPPGALEFNLQAVRADPLPRW